MYLILSTIPHFCSILPLVTYYKYTSGYIATILLSTICSIFYHLYEESNILINVMDHGFAGVWFLYDIYMGYRYTKSLGKIVLANVLSFVINRQIPSHSYSLYHSLWHLINAYKSYYVSNLIHDNISNNF